MQTLTLRISMVPVALLLALGSACTEEVRIDITAPGSGDDRRQSQEFDWLGMVAPGQTLEIKGVVGSIVATPAIGESAEVSAIKRGRRSDPADVSIDVVRHEGGVTICAVYPSPAGRSPNICQPGDWGSLNTEPDNDVEVTFSVLVPAGVVFKGVTIVGDVDADDMMDDAFAYSITGDVWVRTDGIAEAATITGSVTARIGAANWNQDLEFTTVTGDIFIEIPSSTNADVDVSVLNGSIVSDFPLVGAGVGRRTGRIGNGGRNLQLSTITGNVTLRGRS